MKKVKRKFRLNVCVSYSKNVNINNYRNLILSILENFALLYRLDYMIDVNTQVFGNVESDFYAANDIIYFRSTDLTQTDLKKFQKLISDVFPYNPFLGGVEVGYQLQKHLREFPFPKDFYRPLNYPYIESHKDGQTELKIPADFLKEAF
jgi:hypothetical protein